MLSHLTKNITLRKTGTTIVGVKYRDGVVLLSDTRSTIDTLIENSNTIKLHKLADSIYCAGAGVAGDADHLTRLCEQRLTLFQSKYHRKPYVNTAKQYFTSLLHSYGGEIGAAFILGGVDDDGIHLIEVHSHGSSTDKEYATLGSGSLAAISILELKYRRDMIGEEAINLGTEAVEAGIMNDLYSGSNIDYVCIDKTGVVFKRGHKIVACKDVTSRIKFPLNSIRIKKEDVFDFVEEIKDE